jgi:hypothetical protein
VLDALAAEDALNNRILLILAVWRDQSGDGFADDFFGRITEKPHRAIVPTCDRAIEVFVSSVAAGRRLPQRRHRVTCDGDPPSKSPTLQVFGFFWGIARRDHTRPQRPSYVTEEYFRLKIFVIHLKNPPLYKRPSSVH